MKIGKLFVQLLCTGIGLSALSGQLAFSADWLAGLPRLVKESAPDDCLADCVLPEPNPEFCLEDSADNCTEQASQSCRDSNWDVNTGLAIRYRYMHEMNRLRPGGPGLSSYDQWQILPHASITFRETITGYVEAIDASTFGEDLPILPIDENRTDLLQYYVDVKLANIFDGDLHVRYGRQLLNYGDQMVVSPLAWANTYRNFEGFKAYHKTEDWSIDAFAVQPVNGAARGQVFKTRSFDTPDQSRWFSGVYATYRGFDEGHLDLYWLWSLENEPVPNRLDGDRHTVGARYYGNHPAQKCGDKAQRTWHYDFQGALQVGTDVFTGTGVVGPRESVMAGFVNARLGHQWNQAPLKPHVFALYYLGTGDGDPDDGHNHTYYSLYPLGHAFWGILDNFSGQNLVNYSAGTRLHPSEKLSLTGQFHWFYKHHEQDFIYNIGGAPMGPRSTDPGGTTNTHIGNELDLIATYQMSKDLTLECGYSWFWYGGAVTETALNRDDARQFYFMANYRY